MKKIEFDLHGADVMKFSWLLSNGQVVMLTCSNAQKSINGIIALSWVTPTSHQPLLFTASVGNGPKGEDSYRVCYSLINETREFGLNLPAANLADAIIKVGTTHSDEVDKFKEAKLTPLESRKISAPLIEECFFNIECKVLEQFVTGDHTVFVAEPVAAYMDDDVIVNSKFSEKYLNKSNQIQICEVITMFNMW